MARETRAGTQETEGVQQEAGEIPEEWCAGATRKHCCEGVSSSLGCSEAE